LKRFFRGAPLSFCGVPSGALGIQAHPGRKADHAPDRLGQLGNGPIGAAADVDPQGAKDLARLRETDIACPSETILMLLRSKERR
jgi:hypothetical protein